MEADRSYFRQGRSYAGATVADRNRFRETLSNVKTLSNSAARTMTRLRTLASQEMPALTPKETAPETISHASIASAVAAVLALILFILALRAFQGKQHFEAGMKAFESGRTAQAITEFTDCLATNPSMPSALLYRAMSFAQNGEHICAITDYNRIIAMQPQNTDALMARGCEYLRMEDYKNACDDFSQALSVQPQLADAYYFRAATRLKLKEFRFAISDCQAYLSRFGKDATTSRQVSTLLILSAASKDVGKASDAIEACSRAIALRGSDPTLLDRRASLFEDAHDWQKAIADWTRAIKLKPTPQRFAARAYCYQASHEVALSINDLRHCSTSAHSTAQRRAAANEPERNHKHQITRQDTAKLAAVAALSAAATSKAAAPAYFTIGSNQRSSDSDAQMLTMKGYELLRTGNAQQAISVLRAALRDHPENTNARKYLAYALVTSGDGYAAADQFAVLSKMHALLPDDLLPFGKALQQTGETRRAINEYENYVCLRPSNTQARLELIDMYQRTGQASKAWECLREGMRRARNDAERQKFIRIMIEGSGDSGQSR